MEINIKIVIVKKKIKKESIGQKKKKLILKNLFNFVYKKKLNNYG